MAKDSIKFPEIQKNRQGGPKMVRNAEVQENRLQFIMNEVKICNYAIGD